jgi:hypothetical protein
MTGFRSDARAGLFCAHHFADVSKMINEKVNLKRFIARIMYGIHEKVSED